MIVSGSAAPKLAANVAKELGDVFLRVETKKFPDGERYLRVHGDLDEEVTIVQSTGYPQDEHLVELLFLIKNLKDLGVKKLNVVVPYMGYARQERRFNDGEAISAKIVAELIELAGADEFISINLHEDCVREFFNIPAYNLSAMPAIAEYVETIVDDPIIIAPDKGALSFAEEIASIINCDCTYLKKVRLGPDKVETTIAEIKDGDKQVDISSVKGKEAVIVDDIIATGGTIVNAINILKDHGAKSVNVCCVHPTLVNDAVSKIFAAGARDLAGTDTLKSDVSCISVAKIIADHLKE